MKRVLAIICVAASFAFADVPNEITYQGRLREYGQPVNGNRIMNFKIYQAETGPGLCWESGDKTVAVSSGVFSCPLTPANIDWTQKDYWIETVVSGKTLAPREKITSQVFALHSGTAEDLKKTTGTSINFTIGSDKKATLKSTGEFSSLIGGTTYYMVPRGAIIMWSGTIANIPQGWALCDGTNGTPDLRDKFVCGVPVGQEPGVGVYSTHSRVISADQLPSHSHHAISGGQSSDHYHFGNTGTAGVHFHGIDAGRALQWGSGGSKQTFTSSSAFDGNDGNPLTFSAGDHVHGFGTGKARNSDNTVDQDHTHAITVNDTNQSRGNAMDFRPAYYKIAFIMKI